MHLTRHAREIAPNNDPFHTASKPTALIGQWFFSEGSRFASNATSTWNSMYNYDLERFSARRDRR
ncbi:hypothetical protein BQ8482_310021 [Mesorhizobium delmotii]|uniref:Uncharacterized protein n=1 Tax=Mesorhizobium delmotii TaxID=1631247 RepID=A0A2P9ANG5_9HYPH|nr:hypothetical protein BQ8482_310021 [Mesorhizobium delmotii]